LFNKNGPSGQVAGQFGKHSPKGSFPLPKLPSQPALKDCSKLCGKIWKELEENGNVLLPL
jgi:hypothetical protein